MYSDLVHSVTAKKTTYLSVSALAFTGGWARRYLHSSPTYWKTVHLYFLMSIQKARAENFGRMTSVEGVCAEQDRVSAETERKRRDRERREKKSEREKLREDPGRGRVEARNREKERKEIRESRDD